MPARPVCPNCSATVAVSADRPTACPECGRRMPAAVARPVRRDADSDPVEETDRRPARSLVPLIVGGTVLPLILLGGGVYFAVIRPGQARNAATARMQAEHAAMVERNAAAERERLAKRAEQPPPPQPAPKAEPKPEPPKRATTKQAILIDGVTAEIEPISLDAEEVWFIAIVRAADPAVKVDYRSWQKPTIGRRVPSLVDDRGNRYKRVVDVLMAAQLEAAVQARLGNKMGFGDGAVYADRPRADVLVFERPAGGATYLDLDLPAENVGRKGDFRFRIMAADLPKPSK